MLKNFGPLLTQKRKEADLSIQELARLSGLTEASLESFEQGYGDPPTFDTCYRLGQAISARSGRMFVVHDLWQALRTDKLEIESSPKIFQ